MSIDTLDQEPDEEISKSQRKRDADAIRDFAARLVTESPQKLKRLPLSDQLREAIAACPPQSTRGAYKRHVQYLGKLIRKTGDFEQLLAQLDEPPGSKANPHLTLCDQLIESFTDHADRLRSEYPQISLQQARQLANTAAKFKQLDDADEEKSKANRKKADRARQSLLKLLKESAPQQN